MKKKTNMMLFMGVGLIVIVAMMIVTPESIESSPSIEEAFAIFVIGQEQIDNELEMGLDDIRAGRTVPASQAFDKMRKDYHL